MIIILFYYLKRQTFECNIQHIVLKILVLLSLFPCLSNDSIIYQHIILFLSYNINMIIEVQHCVDCHLHNWCSRHNEAKYHEFYQKLESKVKSIFKKVEMVKNNPPKHFQQRNASATMGLQVHHYFDEQRNEEVVFPRHGAFQIKVNGILIFSKLQSNLWPNLQKIMNLLTHISTQIEAGKDIKRFSLSYRMENNKQELAETYKKLIKFKINKRPQSSQFNATAYVLRATTIDQSPQPKPQRFKRKNVTSLKKGTYDGHRKSDASKKPLIYFKNTKIQASNTYSQFKEAKNEEPCQFPEVGKIIKNQHASPHSKKRIHFKGDTLHPIIAQPFDTIGNNNPSLKMEKKPSRKLILKTNEKKNENSPHFSHKCNQNREDSIHEFDKVIINQNTLFFADTPTKKSLKSVMSIGDKLQSKGPNDIKVQDYTQKKIEKDQQKLETKSFALDPTSQFSIKDKTQKLVNQQGIHEQKIEKIVQKRQKNCTEQPKLEEHTQKQQSFDKKQQHFQVKQPFIQLQDQRSNANRKTENSNQKYEQELYDNYEIQQNHQQIRPETSSSRRKYKQELVEKQEEILEYQSVNEGNFKRKNSEIEEKMNIQYEEDFAVEVQKVPIVFNQTQKIQKQQKIIQEQVFQLTVEQQICQAKQVFQEKQAGSIQETPQIVLQAKAKPSISLEISNQNQQGLEKLQYKVQKVIEKEVVANQRNSQKYLLQKGIQTPVEKQDIIPKQLPQNVQVEINKNQEPEIKQKQMIEGNYKVLMDVQQENQQKVQDKTEPIVLNQQIIIASKKQTPYTQNVQKQQESFKDKFSNQVQQKSSVQNEIGQQVQKKQAKSEDQRQQISKLQHKPCQNNHNQLILPQIDQLPVQNQKLQQIINSPIQQTIQEQQNVQAILQNNNQQKISPVISQKLIQKEKAQICVQLPKLSENAQTIFEVKQTHPQQKLQDKTVQLQLNLEIQIQKKSIKQKEPLEQLNLQGAKIHQNVDKIEEQEKIEQKQEQKAIQQRRQMEVSEKNEDKPIIGPQIPKSYEQCAQKAEQAQIQTRRQGPLLSICLIKNKEANSESQKSLPIVTQSTIGLSGQIHSELNNVYEQIQARFDARLSVEQEDNS